MATHLLLVAIRTECRIIYVAIIITIIVNATSCYGMPLCIYLTNLNIIEVDIFLFLIVIDNNISRNIFFDDSINGCCY